MLFLCTRTNSELVFVLNWNRTNTGNLTPISSICYTHGTACALCSCHPFNKVFLCRPDFEQQLTFPGFLHSRFFKKACPQVILVCQGQAQQKPSRYAAQLLQLSPRHLVEAGTTIASSVCPSLISLLWSSSGKGLGYGGRIGKKTKKQNKIDLILHPAKSQCW